MATEATSRAISRAFEDRPDIIQGLQAILKQSPNHANTLDNVANYVLSLKPASTNGVTTIQTKKRKLEEQTESAVIGGQPIFEFSDISFSVPVRKKLRLEGFQHGIRATDAQGNAEVNLSWDSIDHVFCLPVPDRAKPQFNFVIVPQSTSATVEAVVWTAPEPNPKLDTPQESVHTMTEKFRAPLARYNKKVEVPRDEDFAGKSGPKDSKNYGVRAHKGTKEGHIFFLQPGILFAFKKPLIFIPFHAIVSVSYTSVLQRTFNLNIAVREGDSEVENEIEFAMIDQESYAGIDEYIKKRGLNDASLADARRAKVYGVNAPKKNAAAAQESDAAQNGDANGEEVEGDEDDGLTELQRAEKLLQDQEDEEEEDYVDDDEDDDEGSSDGEEYEEGEGDAAADAAEEVEAEYEEEAGGYEDDDPMQEE